MSETSDRPQQIAVDCEALVRQIPGATPVEHRHDGFWMTAPGLDVVAMAELMRRMEARLSAITGVAAERGETAIIYHYCLGASTINIRTMTRYRRSHRSHPRPGRRTGASARSATCTRCLSSGTRIRPAAPPAVFVAWLLSRPTPRRRWPWMTRRSGRTDVALRRRFLPNLPIAPSPLSLLRDGLVVR